MRAGRIGRRRQNLCGVRALCAAVPSLILISPSLATAATLHVTDAGDGSSPAPTLRNQIATAASGDTVVIDPGINPTLMTGEIAIDKNLTIQGQGQAATTVSAGNSSRIFKVGSVTPGAQVTIGNLTLTGGKTSAGANGSTGQDGSAGGAGGAILNSATLTITDATLSSNATGSGGGAGATGGHVGGAGGSGGAISNSGALTIARSTLSGNTTGNGGASGTGAFSDDVLAAAPGGAGGAISNSGTLTVTDATLNANHTGSGGYGGSPDSGQGHVGGSGGPGGAIANTGTLTITNSTLSGNTTGVGGHGPNAGGGSDAPGGNGGLGGAIYNSSTVTIKNATVSGNTAGNGGHGGSPNILGGNGGSGGGIASFGGSASATVTNSIVASNTAGSGGSVGGFAGTGANCGGTITDGGHNIAYSTAGGCPGTFGTDDPKLDPAGLVANGGPTKTIAIQAGSAAINQVPSGCPAADQRGFTRPAGACDIGAFEIQLATDTDGDGVPNATDQCPAGPGPGLDTDGDGCKDTGEDTDDDNDGVLDGSDSCSAGETGWTSSGATDHDGDGCRDAAEDADDDNDTVADGSDQCPAGATGTGNDPDGDGCKNSEDSDDDGDGVADATDQCSLVAAPGSADGCPAAARGLTLKYSAKRKRFTGKLSAPGFAPCTENQEVTVWKKVRGLDKNIGEATTSATGGYKLAKTAKSGKYYSTTPLTVISNVADCTAAMSPTLRA